jgi:hypothetical protein
MIGKFELGQIVATPVRKFSIARFAVLAAYQIAAARRVHRRISVHLIGIRSNASH